MINFKVRFRNPIFIAQLVLAILTPILAYAGLTVADLTTWKALGDLLIGALSNPYVLGLVIVSVFNAVTDPTTEGIKDSTRAMTYNYPHKEEQEGEDDESIEEVH